MSMVMLHEPCPTELANIDVMRTAHVLIVAVILHAFLESFYMLNLTKALGNPYGCENKTRAIPTHAPFISMGQ